MAPIVLFKTILIHLAQAGTNASAESGNEALLIWVFALFAVALTLAALELFIPSGGLIGAASFICSMAAVGVAFKIGSGYGLSALGFMVIATPTTIWLGLKVFPNTPVGKQIILTSASSPEELQKRDIEKREAERAITGLIGARGKTMTALRPGGTIQIEGEDVEAFAETGMIDADVEVEIVSIKGRQLKVREVE